MLIVDSDFPRALAWIQPRRKMTLIRLGWACFLKPHPSELFGRSLRKIQIRRSGCTSKRRRTVRIDRRTCSLFYKGLSKRQNRNNNEAIAQKETTKRINRTQIISAAWPIAKRSSSSHNGASLAVTAAGHHAGPGARAVAPRREATMEMHILSQ